MACLADGHALKDVANWDKHAEARSGVGLLVCTKQGDPIVSNSYH